jgi:hypothetical protein
LTPIEGSHFIISIIIAIMSLAGCGLFDRLPNELVMMVVDYIDDGPGEPEEKRSAESIVW